jgi:hypothetical protein
MLTEQIYKWRGIDKWPTTTATVTSTEIVSEGGRSGRTMNIFFSYSPPGGSIESGKFFVDSYSSLYGLSDADTFDVQFNPRKPSQYYSLESKSLSSDIRLVISAVGLAFVAFLIIVQFLSRVR